SVFVRTLFNDRKTLRVALTYTKEQFHYQQRKPTVTGVQALDNNIALFRHRKDEVRARFPNIIGSVILDLAKFHMYNAYYNGFQQHIKDASLAYMDTDGFVIYSRSPNFIHELKLLAPDWLDCSNLPQDNTLYSTQNKGKLGFFKFETAGDEIEEAVFLKPKMYSIKLKSGREIFRAKGVNRVQGRNFLHHDLFLSVLNNETELHHTLHYIRQMGFKNFNISLRKKTLSCYDDKRF